MAAFATEARIVIGVDHQVEMLEMFRENAVKRNRKSETHLGFWPEISNEVQPADVVTAFHVVYNVSDIESFLTELDKHARKRVVIEMPQLHPLSNLNEAWKFFWDLERPTTPTYIDLLEILGELSIKPHYENWEGEMRNSISFEDQVRFNRIRLCLPLERENEVRQFMEKGPSIAKRKLTTIWWDKE